MVTLHTILVDLLYAGVSAAIAYLAPKAKAFIMTHTTAAERQTLDSLASAAVPFVERAFASLDGAGKMKQAIAFVDKELTALHIPLSATDIEAAIEKAYADAKAKGILSVYTPAKKAAATPAPATPAK